MDHIADLQNRIEQLEAKLGINANIHVDGQRGDSATENLINTASAIHNATEGHEKLSEAAQRATELNNYTDPNYLEKVQENEMHMREVANSEQMMRHHCHCMHRCKQGAPVLESQPLSEVPEMQAQVDHMHMAAAEAKVESDNVSQGVQELAETCGAAAADAAEQLAGVAQNVEQVEERFFPKKRNGLD